MHAVHACMRTKNSYNGSHTHLRPRTHAKIVQKSINKINSKAHVTYSTTPHDPHSHLCMHSCVPLWSYPARFIFFTFGKGGSSSNTLPAIEPAPPPPTQPPLIV
eukprot:GDKI01001130.1.p2 GENE.GDKI01001130.1~~GDKI01001130.1.p2  ORF type:complete len:104 (+),score=5.75 GDKI01001130.1:84-395(+)